MQHSSDKHCPGNDELKSHVEKDIEKDILSTSVAVPEILTSQRAARNAQASGDRALVLIDLDNGLVGWESADDPENPQ